MTTKLGPQFTIYNSYTMKSRKTKSQSSFDEQQYYESVNCEDTPLNDDSFRRKVRDRWTPEQNIKYARFLQQNLESFKCSLLRKKYKVFSSLAKFMGGRNTSQCKSHHQKMLKRHKQVEKIIEHIDIRFVQKLKVRVRRSPAAINPINVVEHWERENKNEEIGRIVLDYAQQSLFFAEIEPFITDRAHQNQDWFE